MKRCPKCGQSYTDTNVNFCLNDGELLSRDLSSVGRPFADDDPPPTLMMDPSRVTDQTNWAAPRPPALYQSPAMNRPDLPGGILSGTSSPNQTMAIASLALGGASLLFGVCCYAGIWLGLPAAVVGFLALRNIQNDPAQYGGRGMAIGGIATGIFSFLISILLIVVILLA